MEERGSGLEGGESDGAVSNIKTVRCLFYLVKIIREAVAIFKINDLKKHDIKGRLLRPSL